MAASHNVELSPAAKEAIDSQLAFARLELRAAESERERLLDALTGNTARVRRARDKLAQLEAPLMYIGDHPPMTGDTSNAKTGRDTGWVAERADG